jgi:hypothetical protein
MLAEAVEQPVNTHQKANIPVPPEWDPDRLCSLSR